MLFRATLASPFQWEKLDKLMRLRGVAITEGTFTGIDGQTIHYSGEVIKQAADTLLAKPILYAHTTDEGDEKFLTVGFVSGIKLVNGSLEYEGFLFNPTVFSFVQEGDVYAVSPELDVRGYWNPDLQRYDAEHIEFTALALTNRPAIKQAVIHAHEYVRQVKLEEVRKKMDETQLPAVEDLAKADEETIEKLQQAYPMPKTKAWGDMTDREKFLSCRLFFKNKGYPLPAAKKELTEEELEEAIKRLEKFVCPVCKKTFAQWQDFFAHWQKQHRDEYGPFKKKGEETGIPEEVQSELEALKEKVRYFQTQEIKRLEEEIQQYDKDFKAKDVLKGIEDFDAQRTMLERIAAYLAKHKPKVKLEVGDDLSEYKQLERKVLSRFSPELRALLEEGEEK